MFGGPLSDIPYRVSFGFLSIDAGMYVWAAALHRRSPPLSAVLPSVGGRCAASAFRSFVELVAASTRFYCARSVCFFRLFVLCMSQPKMSRGVVLFGHMK